PSGAGEQQGPQQRRVAFDVLAGAIPCAESISLGEVARVSKRDIGIIDRRPRHEYGQRYGDGHRRCRKQDRFAFREDGAFDRGSVVRRYGRLSYTSIPAVGGFVARSYFLSHDGLRV